ncbi:hypothetical protein N2152v2_001560 [Parachlorella kessleri]
MAVQVYCLDTSQCATQNEDLPGEIWGHSRLGFQRSLLPCISGACLAGGRLCGSAAVQPHQTAEVALIASHSGKAVVVLPPAGRAELLPALESLPMGGDCNPVAAVKLALLLARRFASTHITAFIASPCQLPPDAFADLQQRLAAAEGVSLDLVVLAHPEELGEAALAGLALLAGEHGLVQPGAEPEMRTTVGEAGTAIAAAAAAAATRPAGLAAAVASPVAAALRPAAAAAARCRVVWAPPNSLPQGVEDWQQLEFVLEKLEGRGSSVDDARAADFAEIDGEAVELEAGQGQHGTAWGPSSSLPQGTATGRLNSRNPFARSRGNSSSRGPSLQRPGAPLLALRSGVHQPALCRGESLDRLGHLSVDGMMRPWLPTYASLGAKAQQQQQLGAGMQLVAGRGAAAAREQCFLQVCPIPKWRTLVRIAAGLMIRGDGTATSQRTAAAAAAAATNGPEAAVHASKEGQQTAAEAGSSRGPRCFASLSSALLRGLASLRLPGEEEAQTCEPGEGRAGECSAGDGTGSSETEPRPVRLVPDVRRGTLRLLQAVKETDLFKLVWQPDEPSWSPQASSGNSGPALASGAGATPLAAEVQPFDMFSIPGAASSLGDGAAVPQAPLAAPQAATPDQPLTHQGIEYWEGGVSWELELLLRAGEARGAPDLATAGAAPAGAGAPVSGRELPNGAQVLLVKPSACGASASGCGGGASDNGALGRSWEAGSQAAACVGRHHGGHHAFWLQQGWDPAQCLSPAAAPAEAGIVVPSLAGHAEGAVVAASPAAAPRPLACAGQPVAARSTTAGQGAPAAAVAAAAAMAGLLAAPPAVDVRQLRRDVKDGSIRVTPVTVGPLPARLVQDLVSVRASIMSSMGVENLDGSAGGGISCTSRRLAGGLDKGRGREEAVGGVLVPACGDHAQDGDGNGAGVSVTKRRRAEVPEPAAAAALQGSRCGAGAQRALPVGQQRQLHEARDLGGPKRAVTEPRQPIVQQAVTAPLLARSGAAEAASAPIAAATARAAATSDPSSAPGTPCSGFGTPLHIVAGAPGCAFAGAFYAKGQDPGERVGEGTGSGGALPSGVEGAGRTSEVGVVAAEPESRDDSMVFELD